MKTPCVPQNVTVDPVCDSNGVVASWSPSLVAEWFSLMATAGDGDVRTCRSSTNNCTLSHLNCGQIYNLSITASAGNCTSQASQQLSFHTAVPCEPQNMTVEVQCDTRTANISWLQSKGSLKYFTSAQTPKGDTLHCDTTGTSCSISGLTCGMLYNFTTQSSDGTCNSSYSVPIQKGAAPCPGLNVISSGNNSTSTDDLNVPELKSVHASGRSLLVEWTPVVGAQAYTLILTQDTPSPPVVNTLTLYQTNQATVSELSEGTVYCVSVAARDGSQQSAYSRPLCATTGLAG
ncbi:hypothetical protein DNTS_026923 [Danionella cerebrum]|uniref:Fibronectin type-III domain-containing protein n=1 Tax=Danionella cerebrum TaxID=2873325 RepID=A0A553QJT0_9TELE|nr:hypothetical protein DNTS_026923 [Danionella translucida]